MALVQLERPGSARLNALAPLRTQKERSSDTRAIKKQKGFSEKDLSRRKFWKVGSAFGESLAEATLNLPSPRGKQILIFFIISHPRRDYVVSRGV
jgi:hypothetical protein